MISIDSTEDQIFDNKPKELEVCPKRKFQWIHLIKFFRLVTYTSPFIAYLFHKHRHHLKLDLKCSNKNRNFNTIFYLGGLLSSSCCLLQLLINSLSLGCAGFSVLDPYRPLLLFSTFGSMLFRSVTEYRAGIRNHRPGLWLITIFLAFTRELLRIINMRKTYSDDSKISIIKLMENENRTLIEIHYNIAVEGIKCEACACGFRQLIQAELLERSSVIGICTTGTSTSLQQQSGLKVQASITWISFERSDLKVYIQMIESNSNAIATEAILRKLVESLCETQRQDKTLRIINTF